ncbi:cell division protein FtsA [Chthonomonas calidirosea]|uniref:Cell division protein FtsA n=1 Tax=Chthonomonas calidirosea (strain DSM 23976 / ICMP 18418 / T49) TaxID=1303518 RepID=S0ETG4_CHTCT|nr:cell division protein FtsA [Chthonomonas calidirosea]CCW34800.1 cell division protein FtsA [Chthonomonas calidirosea T49]CEK12741.1 cell division protein FtsA [Chthonomonas calidirosea]CEK12742.1 cell division protein FtsA [Chthonomonas calidirosea]CEK13759.1 cell division protein FtsA [Chthonomonas calidirosea]
MPKQPTIAALDIGTTKICALIAELHGPQEIVVTGVGLEPSQGIKRGVVVDLEATARAVEQALSKAVQQAGYDIEAAYVGVTGEHIASLNTEGSITITHPNQEITPTDVAHVIQVARTITLPPDRRILHTIPRGFTVDGQCDIRDPIGLSGKQLEVSLHIVHGATTLLENVEKCVTRAGVAIIESVLEPIATAEAVLLEAEKELGVCLVDIGGGTSDVAVFQNGAICHSSVVPIGGNHVTNDLAYGLTVAPEEAERLKTESGSASPKLVVEEELVQVHQLGREKSRRLPRMELVHIIEPRMQELFEMVRDDLKSEGLLGQVPAGLVLSGGGSLLAGCEEVAHDVLALPVRLGTPARLGGLGETLTHPMYATAVGLLRYGAARQSKAPVQAAYRRATGLLPNLIKWFRRFFDV